MTTQTARRDVMTLEEAGKVRRLHGGATLSTTIDPFVYRQRRVENASQKNQIAQMAADLIPDGSAIFIDTGTTCEAFARALIHRRNLQVVTYSLRVATLLSESTNFVVAIPGGFVRGVDGGVFREETADFIRKFKFHFAVISVSGIDNEGDICNDDHAEVSAVLAALAQTKRTILAVDSSKFGKRALVKLCSLDSIHALVTDAPPQGDILRKIQESGVELYSTSEGTSPLRR